MREKIPFFERKWKWFYSLDPNIPDYTRNTLWSVCSSLLVTWFLKIESWGTGQLSIFFIGFISFVIAAKNFTTIGNFIKKQQSKYSDYKLIARGKNNFAETKEELEILKRDLNKAGHNIDFINGHTTIHTLQVTGEKKGKTIDYPNFLTFDEYLDNINMDSDIRNKRYSKTFRNGVLTFLLGIILIIVPIKFPEVNILFCL